MRIEMTSWLKVVGVAFFAAVLCLGMASVASAGSITFDFSHPTGTLGTTQNYTAGGVTITASGFNLSGDPRDLYGKCCGANETGLGLDGETDHEIDTNHFVQLDLTNLNNHVPPYTVTLVIIQSLQSGEGFKIFGSNTAGSLGSNLLASGTGGLTDTVTVTNSCGGGPCTYLDITAASDNVLVDSLTATSTNAPTPEPGTLFMVMSGLGGLWCFRRRK